LLIWGISLAIVFVKFCFCSNSNATNSSSITYELNVSNSQLKTTTKHVLSNEHTD
jgi:hypothetical protein